MDPLQVITHSVLSPLNMEAEQGSSCSQAEGQAPAHELS